jgi:hypothetical protein
MSSAYNPVSPFPPHAYEPATQLPPPPPMATLSVNAKGVLQLHASLRQRLGLRHGQPIDLIPPAWNNIYWHLDLRPSAARMVLWNDNSRARVKGICLPPGLVSGSLTLYLLPGQPTYPHYYPLLPANAFVADLQAP